MKRQVYLDEPNVGKSEKKALCKAIDTGHVSTFGPHVPNFEEKFARFLGIDKAVSVQSGTAALHIALYELGIGRGDEVIVPALTFVATVNPVMYVGAKPVFADVDPETWNIEPSDIERKITKRTRAVIPVHFYGNPCAMDRILRIARKNKICVIEDAAESVGARYNGRYTGTFGDFGCFSFNGNKIITTGGGGMLVGNDNRHLDHVKFLVNQARDESKGYFHPEIGFNYRMTNIEAAIGIAQLGKLKEFLRKKRRFACIYRSELKDIESLSFQESYVDAESSFWFNCVKFRRDTDVASFQRKLAERKIRTRRVFMPVTEFPAYRAYKKDKLKVSYDIYHNGLCLPSSTLNSENDIFEICKEIKRVLRLSKRSF